MTTKSDEELKSIIKKKILVGKTKPNMWDKQAHNIYLDIELKEKINKRNRKTVDLKKPKKFKTLSISGHSKHFAGQIYDELKEKDINFTIDSKKVKEIKSIWRKWHLNDHNAGTTKQQEVLRKKPSLSRANNYDQAVKYLKEQGVYNDRGYKYGTGWLIKPIPIKVENKLKKLLNMKK